MERRMISRRRHLGVILLVIVAAFAIFSVASFYISIREDRVAAADEQLIDLATSNLRSARIFFEGQQSQLHGLALALENFAEMDTPEILSFLRQATRELGYDRLSIITLDGYRYTSDGLVTNEVDSALLHRVQLGESFITDVTHTLADGASTVEIVTPINHPITTFPAAALHCAVRCDTLAARIGVAFLEQESYFHLVDGAGNYVSDGASPNALLMNLGFFDAMEKMTYEDGFSYQGFVEDLKNNRSGFLKYSFTDSYRYAYYTPVGINHWYMMTIAPREVVDASIQHTLAISGILVLNALVIIAILFAYLLVGQLRANRAAALDEKCFRVLAEQIDSIIFEWNFDTGKIISTSNFQEIFGREPVTTVSEQEAILLRAVHQDDIESFTQVFSDVRSGQNVKEARFRVRNAQRDFVWCSLSGVVVYDAKHRPYKAIGTLNNIDEEEKETQLLRNRAEKDLLTELYNKISTQMLVTEYLEESREAGHCGALLMVDLDAFKQVNDSMGHQFGDQVLTQAAGQLKAIFRSTDIVGRAGGDEFIIFVKDVQDDATVRDRAAAICAAFSTLPVCQEAHYHLTGSVGVALFPHHADSFSELYRLADLALYSAKNKGKNQYVIYES